MVRFDLRLGDGHDCMIIASCFFDDYRQNC